MSHLFALEWDPREIRLMVASGKGRQVVIEQAFSIPFEVEDGRSDAAEQIGKRIAAELDSRGLGRGDAVVAVGRNSIELRQLQLPPAPDDNLPEMVRFQATREFNELDDKWLLDFVTIDGTADTPRTVLATAIAPAVLRQIESVCEHAGLKMLRLLLRPCEAALLLESEKSIPRGQVVLLVDPLGVEADLTAVVDGTAIFLRTTRFNADPPPLPALVSEIRRTMAAASNQLSGRKIESVLLCGSQQTHVELARSIEAELRIPVQLFDPLSEATLGRALVQSPPEHPGRFAPLTGMLLAELRPTRHAVDFLHPRRRPAPPDPRKKWMIAGAAAAALLVAWIAYGRVAHYFLAAEVAGLEAKSRQLDLQIAAAKKETANTGEIVKWAEDDTIWLDRIATLNQSLPPAKDAMLDQVSANYAGGQMNLKGWLQRSDDISQLEEAIRAHGGKVNLKGSRQDLAQPPYDISFEADVLAEKKAP